MVPTIRLVLLTALRDRLFASMFALLAALIGISVYLGAGALFEAMETTVVYAAGSSRLLIVLGLIVFTAFHVERLWETREIEAILSRRISRGEFVIAYWIGLAAIGSVFVAPIAGIVVLFAPPLGASLAWAASLIMEIMVVQAFVLFAALTFERAIPTVFSTIGFYAMARLLSIFTGIAAAGKQSGLNQVTNPVMDAIALAIPRLDLFAQTRWLVYGMASDEVFWPLVLQTLIYVPLLLLAAVFDLKRKRF